MFVHLTGKTKLRFNSTIINLRVDAKPMSFGIFKQKYQIQSNVIQLDMKEF